MHFSRFLQFWKYVCPILFSDQNFLCSSFKGDDKFYSIWKHWSVLHVNLRANYKGKWFRADKGAVMSSSCVLKETCGVQAPGWLNGHIPSRETGIVQRKVCFNFHKDCCFYSLPVQIKKCSDFFVYKLKEVHPMIPGKYCFTTNTVGRFTKQCYIANQDLVDWVIIPSILWLNLNIVILLWASQS